MQAAHVLDHTFGLTSRVVARDESVSRARERIGKYIERARGAAALDAVAAFGLWRETCDAVHGLRLGNHALEAPQRNGHSIAAHLYLDRFTRGERRFRGDQLGHRARAPSAIRYIACDHRSGVATAPQRCTQGATIDWS